LQDGAARIPDPVGRDVVMMAAQSFLRFDEVPWGLAVPLSAGLVATVMAFVLSKFFLGRPAAQLTPPEDKPTPEYDPFVQGSETEQRSAFRRGGNPTEVLIDNAQQKGKILHGWVADRSMGGLCLTVDEAFPEGTLLTVRAANAPPATPWVEIRVQSCRQKQGDWELGCQFVKTPPWAVMLLFG